MATMTKAFTASGTGGAISIKSGDSFTYAVTGVFDATVVLEYTRSGGQSWAQETSTATTTTGTVNVDQTASYRWRCSAYVSGTATTTIVDAAATLKSFEADTGTDVLNVTEAGIEVQDLAVAGNTTLTGTLTVTGTQSFTGKITATGGIDVGGGTTNTIASGSTTTLASGATLALETGSTLTASGTATFASGSATTFSPGSGLVVSGAAALTSGSTLGFAPGSALAASGTSVFASGSTTTFSAGSTATFDGTVDYGAAPLHTGGSDTGTVVQRFGLTATEGREVVVIEETVVVSGAAAKFVAMTTPIPDGAVILSAQSNLEGAITGSSGTSAKVGLGTNGVDPDLYGLTSGFTQNLKIDTIPAHAVNSGAVQIDVCNCDAAGAISDTNFISGGPVRVRVEYVQLNSLDNA